jgi:transglutaminase-like putative cysteine protease
MRVQTLPIASGDMGTAQTVAVMRRLVDTAILNPGFRAYAVRIATQYGRDGINQAHGIRQWLEDHVEFIRDPDRVELLQDPVATLNAIVQCDRIAMDCDDVAMLGAAMGRAVGLRARFIVAAFRSPRAPYQHVWSELSDSRQREWVDLDITRNAQALNIPVTRRMVVPA